MPIHLTAIGLARTEYGYPDRQRQHRQPPRQYNQQLNLPMEGCSLFLHLKQMEQDMF